jgi:hypothetical protein
MKRAILATAFVLTTATAWAGAPLRGEYVEARTAEIFAGGCVMSSQAETLGRQAVLAWHVDSGVYDGQKLDGLSVVAPCLAIATWASARSAASRRPTFAR